MGTENNWFEIVSSNLHSSGWTNARWLVALDKPTGPGQKGHLKVKSFINLKENTNEWKS